MYTCIYIERHVHNVYSLKGAISRAGGMYVYIYFHLSISVVIIILLNAWKVLVCFNY